MKDPREVLPPYPQDEPEDILEDEVEHPVLQVVIDECAYLIDAINGDDENSIHIALERIASVTAQAQRQFPSHHHAVLPVHLRRSGVLLTLHRPRGTRQHFNSRPPCPCCFRVMQGHPLPWFARWWLMVLRWFIFHGRVKREALRDQCRLIEARNVPVTAYWQWASEHRLRKIVWRAYLMWARQIEFNHWWSKRP